MTATQFANNLIPAARIHPISKQLLEFYRTPNLPNPDLRNNFVQGQGRPINRDQFIGRMDFVESSKSQWSGRYSWSDENQLNEAINLNGSKIVTNFNQYMGSNTGVLSATMVNEARFGFTQLYNTNGPELAFTRDVVGSLKIPGLVGNQFPRGAFAFSRNATNNLAITQRSGDPVADFLLGETFQAEAAVSIASAKFRSTGLAFYFDDIWKITSKVTMNLGLRYELTPPWQDQTGTLFNGIVRLDARTTLAAPNVADRSLYPFFLRQGEPRQNCYEGINLRWPDIEVRCDGSLGNRLVGVDKNDFAPRVGITWSPTQKWVIRTGAGYFYSQDAGNPRFDMARNLAGRLRDNSRTDLPHLTWANALGAIAWRRCAP